MVLVLLVIVVVGEGFLVVPLVPPCHVAAVAGSSSSFPDVWERVLVIGSWFSVTFAPEVHLGGKC